MSRGELHASKWCRRTKERSIKEGERRERNLASQGVTAIYINEKGSVTGRVACKQIVPRDEKRSIKEGKEEKGKESN